MTAGVEQGIADGRLLQQVPLPPGDPEDTQREVRGDQGAGGGDEEAQGRPRHPRGRDQQGLWSEAA